MLATAVYTVKRQYQSSTLFDLFTGSEVTFTEAKDATRSSGNLKSTLPFISLDATSFGGGATSGQLGDLFMDFDNALVANAQSGWASSTTRTRLSTTMKDSVSSNGHWFGGLGGEHYQAGWGASYESSPSYPYCPAYNMYGTDPGNVAVSSGNNPVGAASSCGPYTSGREAGRHHVDFAILIKV